MIYYNEKELYYKCNPDKRKILGVSDKYYYIYQITNTLTNNIYIGARIFCGKDPFKDNYMGNGFKLSKDKSKFVGYNKNTLLYKEFNNYEPCYFKKDILFFFKNKENLLLAEKIIVNSTFIKFKNVLNQIEGGGNPPIGKGIKNNNYGNKWTKEMKISLSNKKKLSGVHKGIKNPKAKKAIIVDLWKNNIININYIAEVKSILNVKTYEVLKKINKFRYFIIPEDIYLKESKNIDLIAKKYLKNYQVFILITNYFKNDIKDKEDLCKLTGFKRQYVSRFLKNINK